MRKNSCSKSLTQTSNDDEINDSFNENPNLPSNEEEKQIIIAPDQTNTHCDE
jgi:hypothetical protein